MASIRSGVYKHYAGKHYLVIGTAKHTETGEDLVVYVPLYEHPNGGMPLQARPASMWFNDVLWDDGRTRPRFVYVGEVLDPKGIPE